tara:strand:+ start:200 stop:637 length:438 start_codon:yes stop_codon:yes gene_type:complete
MKLISCKIINKSNNPLPKYQTEGASAVDLFADLNESIILKSKERKLIKTGIQISIPDGYEAQVRPRSGLAIKHGITVLNSPGTIDSDYRGEIGVILINHSDVDFKISNGDRIAQLVLSSYEKIKWTETESLDDTQRGKGGFGSTG